MHKKLEADLISLAHSILQMKNKENVFALKEKAQEIYEKLSMLAFVEEFVNTTPTLEETKEEILLKVAKAFENKATIIEDKETISKEQTIVHKLEEESLTVDKSEILEQPFDELEEILTSESALKEQVKESLEKVKEEVEELEEEVVSLEDLKKISENNTLTANFKNDVKDVGERKTPTLEEELKDTFPVDVMANLFEPTKPKSLNDKLLTNIQIGLNDRIVFVKNLFDGSQEDFNRVVSQLNTFKTEKEAKKFLNKMVKPDYNWGNSEELEIRFMEIIERRFA